MDNAFAAAGIVFFAGKKKRLKIREVEIHMWRFSALTHRMLERFNFIRLDKYLVFAQPIFLNCVQSCILLTSVTKSPKVIQLAISISDLNGNLKLNSSSFVPVHLYQPQSLLSCPWTEEVERYRQDQNSPLYPAKIPEHLDKALLCKEGWRAQRKAECYSILPGIDEHKGFGASCWPAIDDHGHHDGWHKNQCRDLHGVTHSCHVDAALMIKCVGVDEKTRWADDKGQDQGWHAVFWDVDL